MSKNNRRKRVNTDRLRFAILTELPKLSDFSQLPNTIKDSIIEHLLYQIDKATEGSGDLYD